MKKTLWIIAVLAAWTLVLTGCEKTNVENESTNEPVVEETTIKQSLDMWELISAIENNFPKSYSYEVFNYPTDTITETWTHIYNRMDFWYITPEHQNIIDREVSNSWIEDWMIYTILDVKYDDGRTGQVLFINNPETLDFVAANILGGDDVVTYHFNYDEITSLTYSDLESVAENNFPTSSTYTKVIRETEEATTGDVVYPEDTPNNLTNITPDFAKIAKEELLSSGIEDGMIYTNFGVEFENGTTGNVLYINDPETLNFVAATVESEGIYVNYQFQY